jgi:hypothetical protein
MHLIVDGEDQGDIRNDSPLSDLGQGRQVIEVALADAAHNGYLMRDRRALYIVRDGKPADYEDGLDTRGSRVSEPSPGSLLPICCALTHPHASREIPVDNDASRRSYFLRTRQRVSLAEMPAQHCWPAARRAGRRAGGAAVRPCHLRTDHL